MLPSGAGTSRLLVLGSGHGVWSPRSRSRLEPSGRSFWLTDRLVFSMLRVWFALQRGPAGAHLGEGPSPPAGGTFSSGSGGPGRAPSSRGQLRSCVLPSGPGAEGVPWLLWGPAPTVLASAALAGPALSLKLAGGGCLPPLPGVSLLSGILPAEAKLCLKNRELE